ncbi:inositol-tetrakisphosphate 1-kinase-like [Clytia hemisphaerica]|uniref:Inositol-tetrakisphosphate 1-kinase n=1 Tax=Clytia hemisphaerica TaxID=252671 RepID=A0A7M5WJM1_9CNID
MEDTDKKPIHLGLLIPKEKKKKIKLPERIADLCLKENIKITEVDIHGDLESQGPFDVFFHKVVDIHKDGLSLEETENLIQKTVEYSKRHPEMVVVDDFEVVIKLMKRQYQVEILNQCSMTVDGVSVYVPTTVEIPGNTALDVCRELIERSGIKFPILAKPLASCLDGAHDMKIIFSDEKLFDLPVPCLLQEFCNHGGVIYKVFVIGDRVSMCERPSIQNIDCDPNQPSLVFDTRNVSKTGRAFIPELHGTDPNARAWLSGEENPNMLNKTVIQAIVERLSKVTRFRMYGFDILKDLEGNYALVDLNHFPGYSGISDETFKRDVVNMIKSCAGL